MPGSRLAEEGQFRQGHIDGQQVVAEFAGALARAREGIDVVEQQHLVPRPVVLHGFVLGETVDAPVQPQVRALRKLPGQFVLGVGVEQVEL
jgi:hypothetical protein